MLESKSYDILDPFQRVGGGVLRKSLADNNLDTAHIIAGVPVILVKQLASEGGKLQLLQLALLRDLWKPYLSAQVKVVIHGWDEGHTGGAGDQARPLTEWIEGG